MSSRLLLIPLDDVVAFPGMSLTLAVDAGEEERVLLVPRHENEFAHVGTVAEVSDRVRLPGGARAVALQGLHRGVAGAARRRRGSARLDAATPTLRST
jgi:ATP-dependent Lon protease